MSNLSELDYAVAKCRNEENLYHNGYSPSANWEQGGPIIAENNICLRAITYDFKNIVWEAAMSKNVSADGEDCFSDATWLESGSSPLEAAMRVYVAANS